MSLAVDGNGTFDRATALRYVEALSAYPLAWLEEPVHPLDFELHREVAGRSGLPLATGENLFSVDDARNLLRYGGLRSDRDVLQFDISLSYGLVEYLRILDELAEQGWHRQRCAPHAGHLFAMNAVGGLGLGLAETAMDTTTLFGELTAGIAISDGRASLPDTPGTGFEAAAGVPANLRRTVELRRSERHPWTNAPLNHSAATTSGAWFGPTMCTGAPTPTPRCSRSSRSASSAACGSTSPTKAS